jgi:hypothetical protein
MEQIERARLPDDGKLTPQGEMRQIPIDAFVKVAVEEMNLFARGLTDLRVGGQIAIERRRPPPLRADDDEVWILAKVGGFNAFPRWISLFLRRASVDWPRRKQLGLVL